MASCWGKHNLKIQVETILKGNTEPAQRRKFIGKKRKFHHRPDVGSDFGDGKNACEKKSIHDENLKDFQRWIFPAANSIKKSYF